MAFVAEPLQHNGQDLRQNMSQFPAKAPGMVRQSLQQPLRSITDEIAAIGQRCLRACS
jgi:hypothetical protein